MLEFTSLEIMKQIGLWRDKFDLDLNGLTYDECFEVIRENCPLIISDSDMRAICKENLNKIENEFGYRGLRVWFNAVKNPSMVSTGIKSKYYNLIPHIDKFHNELFKNDLTLNHIIYWDVIKDVYFQEYGDLLDSDFVTQDAPNELYHIMKTIELSGYDNTVINALQDVIYNFLDMYNMKYYLKLDMSKEENLSQLELHLYEENYDYQAFRGKEIFHNDDGWGNVFMNKWEDYVDEDGRKWSKFIRPETSIDDFKKVGSIYDPRLD